jgi:ATP-dependent Clp protease ATP-binding subunit ClpC
MYGIKDRYEKFHAVSYTDEAIESAVYTSNRYIPDRFPAGQGHRSDRRSGRAREAAPDHAAGDLADIQKRIKFIVHRMENAIANHEFEKARFYSDEERKERENQRQLREKYNLDDSSTGVVTKDDIEEVVARWTGVPMTAIKEEEIAKLLRIEEELHKRIISQEKAISALARAIRRSRAGLKAQSSRRFVPVPGTDRRRQNRSGARPGQFPVRQREESDPLRHVGVHGEAFGLEADRFASRLRGLRGRRPAYGAREARAVFDHSARRNREGASGYLQHPAAGVRRRPVDRRSGQPDRFQEHDHHHDFEPGRAVPREARPSGLPGARLEGQASKVEDQVRGEVKRAFNPEFLNRLDDMILFTLADRRRSDQDHGLLVRDQQESGNQADQDPAERTTPPSTSSRRPARTAVTARVRCGGRCRSTLRIRFRKR